MIDQPPDYLRDPAWRWFQAAELADNSKFRLAKNRNKCIDDVELRKTIVFLNDLNAEMRKIKLRPRGRTWSEGAVAAAGVCSAAEYEASSALFKKYPDLAAARTMFIRADTSRWCIEGLLLAGSTDELVAEYRGCPVSVITTYRSIFYNVASCEKRPGCIVTSLVHRMVGREMGVQNYDVFYKFLGVTLGEELLLKFLMRDDMDINTASAKLVSNCTHYTSLLAGLEAVLVREVTPDTAQAVLHDSPQYQERVAMLAKIKTLGERGEPDGTDPLREIMEALTFSVRGIRESVPLSSEERAGTYVNRLAEATESATTDHSTSEVLALAPAEVQAAPNPRKAARKRVKKSTGAKS